MFLKLWHTSFIKNIFRSSTDFLWYCGYLLTLAKKYMVHLVLFVKTRYFLDCKFQWTNTPDLQLKCWLFLRIYGGNKPHLLVLKYLLVKDQSIAIISTVSVAFRLYGECQCTLKCFLWALFIVERLWNANVKDWGNFGNKKQHWSPLLKKNPDCCLWLLFDHFSMWKWVALA